MHRDDAIRHKAFGLLALVMALGLVACQDATLTKNGPTVIDEPDINTPDMMEDMPDMPPDQGMVIKKQCMPLDRYFVREVWAKVASQQCQGCHNPQGIASATDFVLYYSDGYSDHVERNVESMSTVAAERIQKFGFRSKLLLKPIGELDHGGGKIFEENSDSYNILKDFVSRVESEDPCSDTSDNDYFDGFVHLSKSEHARKVSLSLAGRLPTDEELMAVENGGDEAMDALVTSLMSEPKFYDRMVEGFNDIFLTDFFFRNAPENVLDANHYPERKWFDDLTNNDEKNRARTNTRFGLTREPLELIRHVIKEDKPFTEVLTADYIMVNPMSARAYGVLDDVNFSDNDNRNEFKPVKLPKTSNSKFDGEGFAHSGILTSYMYLNRYPSTNTNRNRHRARMFYKHFLGTDILELAPRGGDPTTVANYPNPIRDATQCSVCHYVLDPVAGAFQNFNNTGRYAPLRDGWYTDSFPPGYQGKDMFVQDFGNALQWLAKETIKDRQFAQSMVGHAYYLLMGRYPLKMPKDPLAPDFTAKLRAYEVQREYLKRITQGFVDDNFNFKNLIRVLAKSPYYTIKNVDAAPDTDRMGQLHDAGTAHLLTPRQLHRKIEAIFGEAWKINNRNVLLDGNYFLYLYGGIDSDQVTERLSEPNGLMGGIINLMANDVACRMVAKDFNRPVAERLLFPHVEVADLPADKAQAIKQNLQHLYQRVLGEQRDLDDVELLRAYQLFVDIQADGAKNVADETYKKDLDTTCRNGNLRSDEDYTVRAWMGVVSYMLSDYNFLYE